MELAKLWDVYRIPLDKDKGIRRFINRARKTKKQINPFLTGLK